MCSAYFSKTCSNLILSKLNEFNIVLDEQFSHCWDYLKSFTFFSPFKVSLIFASSNIFFDLSSQTSHVMVY